MRVCGGTLRNRCKPSNTRCAGNAAVVAAELQNRRVGVPPQADAADVDDARRYLLLFYAVACLFLPSQGARQAEDPKNARHARMIDQECKHEEKKMNSMIDKRK